jgi:hypothetical protein
MTTGIFKGPTALGIALGATGASCTADNVTLIKKIQAYLQQHGCANVKIDGQWQGCTASAFRKVFGRPYVTNDDIKLMTGQSCSSDDLIGNISLAYTIPGINTCTDGSDGCASDPGSGSVPKQDCPAGQVWNDFLKTCVVDIFGQNQAQPTPQQQQCPSGQTWFEALKMCVPSFGTPQPNSTQGTYLLPGEVAPSECKPGNYKNPMTGKCTGPQGIEIAATECPSGYMKNPLTGNCIQQIGGAQPQGGACPAGQMNVPLLGCIANPFGSGQQGTTPTNTTDPNSMIGGIINGIASIFGGGIQPAGTCPPGSVYSPVSKGCVSANGTTPAIQQSPPENSVFGSTGAIVVGILAVGAAAAGYMVYKRKKEEMMLAGMSDEELLGGDDPFGLGGDPYGDPYAMYAMPNRRRRGRKSRRRSRRHCR